MEKITQRSKIEKLNKNLLKYTTDFLNKIDIIHLNFLNKKFYNFISTNYPLNIKKNFFQVFYYLMSLRDYLKPEGLYINTYKYKKLFTMIYERFSEVNFSTVIDALVFYINCLNEIYKFEKLYIDLNDKLEVKLLKKILPKLNGANFTYNVNMNYYSSRVNKKEMFFVLKYTKNVVLNSKGFRFFEEILSNNIELHLKGRSEYYFQNMESLTQYFSKYPDHLESINCRNFLRSEDYIEIIKFNSNSLKVIENIMRIEDISIIGEMCKNVETLHLPKSVSILSINYIKSIPLAFKNIKNLNCLSTEE